MTWSLVDSEACPSAAADVVDAVTGEMDAAAAATNDVDIETALSLNELGLEG